MKDDRRLIEDYLPIQAISKEASREKNVRKGHISTLHLWWARRPLVACRAAVYGALVPANRWVKDVEVKNPPADSAKAESYKNGALKGLNRAAAGRFVTELCKYPGSPRIIQQAQEHILDAHADRLTEELKEAKKTGQYPAWVDEFNWPKDQMQVTRNDIEKGRVPRPRVLDMFAGGGAIPLEALRLGCEAYALDLNPVAHIIQLCTLVYPQKYGKPDPNAPGMTGPAGKDGKPTWGGLADEVRYWGNWVLEKVKAEIGDLYPLIPDPAYKGKKKAKDDPMLFKTPVKKDDVPQGYLIPVAYLWTRTVTCKNPACGATVPLVKQTWLCKKKGRYAALRMVTPKGKKKVRFEVVEHSKEKDFDFDPAGFSSAGNATCPFCGTVADSNYVKNEGCTQGLSEQLMAVACKNPRGAGCVFLTEHQVPSGSIGRDVPPQLIEGLDREDISALEETITGKGADQLPAYGIRSFRAIFRSRSHAFILRLAGHVRLLHEAMSHQCYAPEYIKATRSLLGLAVDRVANYLTTLCIWRSNRTCVLPTFSRQALAMTWDYGEMNPFAGTAGDWAESYSWVSEVVETLASIGTPADVTRASAVSLPYVSESLDAVITDPPYYDNVIYSDLSDIFYILLKRSIGDCYPAHFAGLATPKKAEAVSAVFRHKSRSEAKDFYENTMSKAFADASRVLKTHGALVCVYAHKTTLGWSTLVDALRTAQFEVAEAWPVDTEMTGGMRVGTAALASSIFLVARKRPSAAGIGDYAEVVRPELISIVNERVASLWEQGITGADLVIAAVGAGLRAFTKYERVEFANGEEVPAERFLAEVEGVVLDVMLEQIAGKVASGVTAVDGRSRFYVLWRYVYKAAAIDAGEAIVFTYGQHVELDGQKGLSSGRHPLIEKKKSTYRLRDFAERGEDEKLGLPDETTGEPAPLIDALHRVLWLMEHSNPATMSAFFREARINRDQLRVLAQALSGPALKGGELGEVSGGEELAALTKLTANWRSVVEDALSPLERGTK